MRLLRRNPEAVPITQSRKRPFCYGLVVSGDVSPDRNLANLPPPHPVWLVRRTRKNDSVVLESNRPRVFPDSIQAHAKSTDPAYGTARPRGVSPTIGDLVRRVVPGNKIHDLLNL